jgi:acetylornithine deacetylase/succinyl-diaminopimelate desuccinylase-like protein
VVADDQVSVVPALLDVQSAPSALRPEIVSAIKQVSDALWPGAPVIPIMSTGASDSRFLRNAGIPVYGTSGLANNIDESRAHGKDERVPVKSFYDGQEYLYRLVKILTSAK